MILKALPRVALRKSLVLGELYSIVEPLAAGRSHPVMNVPLPNLRGRLSQLKQVMQAGGLLSIVLRERVNR